MGNRHSAEMVISGKRGNTTYTIYPDADTETISVDGHIVNAENSCSPGVTFSSSRSATDSTYVNDVATLESLVRIERCGGGNGGSASYLRNMFRTMFLFDTSSVTPGSSIDSATLSFYGYSVGGATSGWLTSGQRTVYVSSSTPGSNTALAMADWDQIGATSFFSSDYGDTGGSWNTSGYNAMALNAAGISNITLGGVSKFSVQIGADFTNSEPAQTGGAIYYLYAYYADQTGTTQDPKLVVETSSGSSAAPLIQNSTFTYDAVGNITQIADASETLTSHTTVYSYDDLHRLVTASTTLATSTPYSHSYAYDRLGNLTSKSDVGTYLYQGTTTGSYANPHVSTRINGQTLSYDRNGNLTNYAASTYGWDYRNRLTAAYASSSPTTLFGYDHTANRVFKGYNGATTTMPSKYYNIEIANFATSTATTTKSIFTPSGELVATVTTVGATSTRKYIHTDHLGGANVGTDSNGNVVQTLDYYPFGTRRINSGTDVSQKEFTGYDFDEEVNLHYAGARYYDQDRGQFMSQDPVFINMGVDPRTRLVLQDPQLANAYSYARNNPLILTDDNGEFVSVPWIANSQWAQESATAAYNQGGVWRFAMDHPYTTSALVAVGTYPALASGGTGAAALRMATWPGVSAAFAAKQGFAAIVYGTLTANSTLAVPGFVDTLSRFDPKNPSSVFSAAWAVGTGPAASAAGGYIGAFADAYQFGGLLGNTLGSAANNLFSNSIQTRTSTANQFNSAIGSGSGGGSTPSNNSLWVTPSGAVVNWGGNLVSPPPSQ